jgi:hypothetical protein
MANSVRGNADVDAMATLNGQSIQILVWNYHDDLVATTATPVALVVKVPAAFGSAVTVAHLRVDETHSDAYTVWKSQGSPGSPSAAQVLALQQGDPAPRSGCSCVVGPDEAPMWPLEAVPWILGLGLAGLRRLGPRRKKRGRAGSPPW